MGPTLDTLRELQQVELQIVDIRSQLAARERRVQAQNAKRQAALEALEKERAELTRVQIDLDELDLDLKSRTVSADRLREHLNAVKTNKEYAAVLSQLNTEKSDATRVESQALQKLEGIDIKKALVAECLQAEQKAEQLLENAKTQLEQTRTSFAERLDGLDRQRATVAAKLEPGTATLFDRLSERYEGEVVAKILRTHPRRDEFICEGCNMGLTAEIASALLTRDDVKTCKNCGRILFIEKGT